MKGYTSETIRNVALLGHGGCGKTTFIKNQSLKGNHISRDKIRFSLSKAICN